jgi:hypothetical protein
MRKTIKEIIKKMIEDPEIKTMIEEELVDSPTKNDCTNDTKTIDTIRIDKECRILLENHNYSKEIVIAGFQAKMLFIFYLLSPIAISNSNLTKYTNILANIYNTIRRFKIPDNERSKDIVNNMLIREGGINDANNKIRKALKKVVEDDAQLKYYIISGQRSGERSIRLSKELITIENEHLQKIQIVP